MSSAVVHMRELRLHAVGAVIFQTGKASNTETSLWKWRRGAFFGFLRAMAQEKRPVVVPHAASSHAPFLAV
jgi:hypothetical protein